MILVKGNFLSLKADAYVASTNGVIRIGGRNKPKLVMGKGAAAALNTKFYSADMILGEDVVRRGSLLSRPEPDSPEWIYSYAGSCCYYSHNTYIGAFQAKLHWKEASKMELISEAVTWWRLFSLSMGDKFKISMNFPGIGLGGLRREVVEPVISQLPDTFTVCLL